MDVQPSNINLLDLPLEDVILEIIFPHLSWKDLFILRVVSKQYLTLVARYFLKIRVLDLTYNYKITGTSFKIIANGNSSLEVLKIPHCNLICDNVLIPVLENSRKLKDIDLAYCQGLTSKSVNILSTRCQNLEKANLTSCKWLDCQTLMDLAKLCQKLVSINLTRCHQLKDDDLVNFADVCRYRLEDFSVAGIYGITDRILFELAIKCRSLISLDISNCWEMTDDGVRMIGMHCGNLKKLHISGCTKVTAASLGSLRNCLDKEKLQMLYAYEQFAQFGEWGIRIPI